MSKEHEAARRLWVADLRSQEYDQTVGRLSDGVGGYCCLGIACEAFIKSGGKLDKMHCPDEEYPVLYGRRGEGEVCPVEVVKWLGLSSDTGQFGDRYLDDSLADRNDKGYSFAEIADIIESNPPGLFTD